MIRVVRKNGVVLLDDEDAWVLQEYHLDVRVRVRVSNPYPRVLTQCKRTKKRSTLGRVLLGITDPRLQADHINNDGFDNRRENLRVVDRDLQSANRRSENPVGYKGVNVNAPTGVRPYRAKICRRGSLYYGPQRPCPELAALDYNRMAIALWGQQIVLNDVRCVAMEPRPAHHHCMFCNAPCHCCCVCFDEPSPGMRRLFETLNASYAV